MTTTALYVELIVIGAQVEFWILILLEAFNRKLFDSIFHATDNAFIIIAALIPAYVLGMIFDRFADKVFSKREQKIKHDSGLRTSSSLLIEETPKMHEFQLYTRSKYRVLRATALNMPLITISLIVYTWKFDQANLWAYLIILLSGILLSISALWGSIKTVQGFYDKAHLIEEHHNKK